MNCVSLLVAETDVCLLHVKWPVFVHVIALQFKLQTTFSGKINTSDLIICFQIFENPGRTGIVEKN